jgi:hypothetical protein
MAGEALATLAPLRLDSGMAVKPAMPIEAAKLA